MFPITNSPQSPQTLKTLEIARANNWWFRVGGNAPLVEEPVFINNWWIGPPDKPLPPAVTKRVETIRKEVPIQGVVVLHETSHLLPAPEVERKPVVIPWKKIGLVALGVAVAPVLASAAVVTLFMVGTVMALGGLALLDPVWYVVLEDGTWIEVYSDVD